jgi:hypothetical protein
MGSGGVGPGSPPHTPSPAAAAASANKRNSILNIFNPGSRHVTATPLTSASNDAMRPGSAAMRAFPPGPRAIRFLTYNLFMRPPGIKNNLSDYKNVRLSVFLESALKRYDVVCLQEMFAYGSTRQAKLLAAGKKLGFEWSVCSPSRGMLNATVDGGLVIMSRYPIVKSDRMTFKKSLNNDRYVHLQLVLDKKC